MDDGTKIRSVDLESIRRSTMSLAPFSICGAIDLVWTPSVDEQI